MKRFFVLTLTILFTVCIILTNVTTGNNSVGDYGYADDPIEDVYGYVWLTLWFDHNNFIAYSSHHFFINNGENIPIRYYYNVECDITGPTFFPRLHEKGNGWVPVHDEVVVNKTFTYDMENARRGHYNFTGSTDVQIKADTDGNGTFDASDGWRADAVTEIEIEDDDD